MPTRSTGRAHRPSGGEPRRLRRRLNFELSDEQRLLRDTVRDFARNEVAPVAEELDRTALGRLPMREYLEFEVVWPLRDYLGFAEDTAEQRRARLKQCNLVGPAGFVSMEDGCIGGFVQRGAAAAQGQQAVLEMGGGTAESSNSRASEASVRGFWKAYRESTGL